MLRPSLNIHKQQQQQQQNPSNIDCFVQYFMFSLQISLCFDKLRNNSERKILFKLSHLILNSIALRKFHSIDFLLPFVLFVNYELPNQIYGTKLKWFRSFPRNLIIKSFFLWWNSHSKSIEVVDEKHTDEAF